ncbi:rod shape-determining protein MreD [Thiobacillus sedimenti]|uniref:Rod shape-determining protein MreD n=1 Tax=Thiobacillus sedimenti TaxID=3110231 RepID=A0ABZ1CJZ4_9PROT|nr:rod shape-determining protein MreD [Thiobacillus sp. SCUT-2]WRS39592.1 rod shape-determining protein MreD [Thiobacillus sp. SCUT-2]
MNDSLQHAGGWRRILGTLALAVLIEQMPWSGWGLVARPDFLLVAVLFWALHQPARVGFATAFLLGLLTDFQDGPVFGQHAIAYVMAAYLVQFLRLRLLQFEPLRQAAQMFPILLGAQLVVLLVGWLAVNPPAGLDILIPVPASTLLWYLVALFGRIWHGKGAPHRA